MMPRIVILSCMILASSVSMHGMQMYDEMPLLHQSAKRGLTQCAVTSACATVFFLLEACLAKEDRHKKQALIYALITSFYAALTGAAAYTVHDDIENQ